MTAEERVKEALRNYLALAGEPNLILFGNAYLERMRRFEMIDSKGQVFLSDDKPRESEFRLYMNKKSREIFAGRPIKDDELDRIYSSIEQLLTEGADAIRVNMQRGCPPNVTWEDVLYKFNEGIMNSFESGTPFADTYRVPLERFVKPWGRFEAGEKR